RARPVASLLAASGTSGTLTADFLRSSVVGAANPGATPLEKAGNPLLEAWQLAVRSGSGVAGRVLRGRDYPGLAELIDAFYAAAAAPSVRRSPAPTPSCTQRRHPPAATTATSATRSMPRATCSTACTQRACSGSST